MKTWKITAMGMALVTLTSLTTGIATSYFSGPRAEAQTEVVAPRAVATPAPVAYRPAAAPKRVVYRPVPQSYPSASPTYPTPVAVTTDDGCAPKDKWLRVGKDGLIGAVAGALLGAGGGAIADGKSGAGKGAAIGGIGGAAVGAAYGLYQNKTTCGTVLN